MQCTPALKYFCDTLFVGSSREETCKGVIGGLASQRHSFKLTILRWSLKLWRFVIYYADDTKIKTLEKQFLNLQKKFSAELRKDKSVTADTLLETLYILPVELQVEYRKFLDEKIPTLEQRGTVLMIFGQLSRHSTFLDYGLLRHVIEELGSEKLQQDMAAYVASIEVFLDETSVQQLIDYWPSQRTTPPDFEELKAIVYRHPKLCSLRQLDNLRKSLCSETHLSQLVVVLKRVGRSNSFTVSWLVPSALASQLRVSLTQVSDTFYEKNSSTPFQ